MPNINKSKIIYSILAILLLTIGIAFSLTSLPEQTEKENSATLLQNKLFVATHDNKGTIYINIFDPNTSTSTQKIIKIKDAVNEFSKGNAAYANDAIQYNEKTDTVYISTSGASAYDGSCLNADGTCDSRIYRLGTNDKEPIRIYSEKWATRNWIVNPNDTIMISSQANDSQIISLIDGKSAQQIFSKEYPFSDNLTQFVHSNDGEHVYQFAKEYQSKKSPRHIVSLRTYSLTTGEMTTRELVKDDFEIQISDTLSPDENKLAYYKGPVFAHKALHILDLSMNKTLIQETPGEIRNLNLIWSGDSNNVIQIMNDSIESFSLKTNKYTKLLAGGKSNYIHTWAPSNQYITYAPYGPSTSETTTLQILDIKNQRTIDSGIRMNNEYLTAGVRWF